HIVELIGQRLDLVAGLDLDALCQVAAADACRSGAERLNWHHHSPGEKHAGDESERQRAKQNEAGALDRGIKRCIGLFDWRLHKDNPAERINGRGGGEYPVARNILSLLNLLRATTGSGNA